MIGAVQPAATVHTGDAIVTPVFALPAAVDGATDNRPKPNADTATSAMRLIDVFVDICFLSIRVDLKDFFKSAWLRNAFSSDMSEPFLGFQGSYRGGKGSGGWGLDSAVHERDWSDAGY